jgi:hypothetical protein
MAKSKRQPALTAAHKEALAAGREQSRAIRNYLDALDKNRPKRGRKRTPDSIKKRLAAIDTSLSEATGLKKLELVQERINLQREAEQLDTKVDLSALEKAFVDVAKGYSKRKGITYGAWREVGVSSDVLKRAGISRGAAS